jgi:hypothetical protein
LIRLEINAVDNHPQESRVAAADWDDYRWHQDAQRRRYEQAGVGGGQHEFDQYFGRGEHRGDGVEQLISPKQWMQHSRTQQFSDLPAHEQEWHHGYELGERHNQDIAKADFSEMDRQHAQSPHPDHFYNGYVEGLNQAPNAVHAKKLRPLELDHNWVGRTEDNGSPLHEHHDLESNATHRLEPRKDGGAELTTKDWTCGQELSRPSSSFRKGQPNLGPVAIDEGMSMLRGHRFRHHDDQGNCHFPDEAPEWKTRSAMPVGKNKESEVDRVMRTTPTTRIAIRHGWAGEGTVRIARQIAQSTPRIVRLAHDSGDAEVVFHCPFCGSGQVLARNDGTIECQFCQACFTVQVQPQYPAFPQTINGMPVNVPGMGPQWPGEEEPDPGAPDPNGMPVPSDTDQDADGIPDDQEAPEEEGEESDDENPFAKKSLLYRTDNGDWLDEQQYMRHLALQHTGNRQVVLEQIRKENAMKGRDN